MIEIYLSENYSKGLLKTELEWIKNTASRELTYNNMRVDGLDVFISNYLEYPRLYIEEWSKHPLFKDNVLIFIDNTRMYEYLNGEEIRMDSMEDYIKEM